MSPILAFLAVIIACLVACFAVVFVLVPVLKGIGWLLTNLGRGIIWFFAHIFEFIGGMISDVLRFIGATAAFLVLLPIVPLNVVLGRWSAAGHFARAVRREASVGARCIYRVVLRRPLKLVMLHGLLEGLEERVPEALAGAPASDKPGRRIGQFRGYEITGSLAGGGSGAKLYIAEPDPAHHKRPMPEVVVIKSFALEEGSSLPQIVRESRALECAKSIGLVLDHEMDEHRFFYVMPFHSGENLGIATRQLHGETAGRGLESSQLRSVMAYARDLLSTLNTYHAAGLWHKDVKPDNIIIDNGEAHLVDLGLVTPLRSAMTLTTHGTEYFRDPEMVRQALRGVKVHQVDGTRFDVYAAGAVLYFMLENTFPAHGGLSRFSKKSPEALRWIVRRAMADYNQRYTSSQMMLDDLLVVAAAWDAYAVKPAELPSMGGEASATFASLHEDMGASSETQPESNAHAAAPGSFGSPGTPGTPGSPGFGGSGFDASPSSMKAAQRPSLRVTNWWTGAYVVEDTGHDVDQNVGRPGTAAHTTPIREQAENLRQQAHALRDQVRSGNAAARKALHDSTRTRMHAVRDRAQERRDSTKARRHARGSSKRNVPMLLVGFLCMLTILIGGAAVLLINVGRRMNAMSTSIAQSSEYGASRILVGGVPLHESDALPVVLINRHPGAMHPIVISQVNRIIDRHEDSGYYVVEEPFEGRDELEKTYVQWVETGRDKDVDARLEVLLAEHNLYGLLDVVATGKGQQVELRQAHGQMIWSEADDAKSRRWLSPATLELNGTFLVIDDHPRRMTPPINREINRLMKTFKSSDITIMRDSEKEAQLRRHLNAEMLTTNDREALHVQGALMASELEALGLDGVLYITADADYPKSVVMYVIEADNPQLDIIMPGTSASPTTGSEIDEIGWASSTTMTQYVAPSATAMQINCPEGVAPSIENLQVAGGATAGR
jgi:serine/threonine protein kinase